MNLVITDSGLGGLSVCAKLLRILTEPSRSYLPHSPFGEIQITYINAVPSNNRGYNSMSGKAEQLKTFENILWNTEKIFFPDYIFVACGTLSVLLNDLEIPKVKNFNIEGILPIYLKLLFSKMSKDTRTSAIIFGTPTTIKAKSLQNELCRKGVKKERIITQECPNLATQISNDPDGLIVEESIQQWVRKALRKLPENHKNTLLVFLACTHYGYRQEIFQKSFYEEGLKSINLLNPNYAAAEFLKKIVSKKMNSNKTKSNKISIEFVSPYAIPKKEIITLTQLLSPISPVTAQALQNSRICPELLKN